MASESQVSIKNHVPGGIKEALPAVDALVKEFIAKFSPLEPVGEFLVLTDAINLSRYCECHILASKLTSLGTIDVPLDPVDQAEYRANRDIEVDHVAFSKMQEDAKNRRSFSNIVAEYTTQHNPDKPIKIIGGQHRFEAIRMALEENRVDEYHGVKVYFGLDTDQRLDVQLISNTTIAVSRDLIDRMQETVRGPELRNWCQTTGLLQAGKDFSSKRERGAAITVQSARTFITNYLRGKGIDDRTFDSTDTTPVICDSGDTADEWELLKKSHPKLWEDAKLLEAGKEFSQLILAQRAAWSGKKKGGSNRDYAEKTLNFAILAAWAYVAGVLHKNQTRLAKHYSLKAATGKDPLNAAVLAKGKHKTDPENYRGLGYRTDAKERGRFVELFYSQAEKGDGINPTMVDLAIKKYHAKQAQLEVIKVEGAT